MLQVSGLFELRKLVRFCVFRLLAPYFFLVSSSSQEFHFGDLFSSCHAEDFLHQALCGYFALRPCAYQLSEICQKILSWSLNLALTKINVIVIYERQWILLHLT